MFNHVRTCSSKYSTFTGRASRAEYWSWWLLTTIISAVCWAIDYCVFGSTGRDSIQWVSFGVSLALLLPSLAVTVRRLHDTGKSAWWLCWALLPFVGGIVLFIAMLQRSHTETNQYGPQPLTSNASPAESHTTVFTLN